MLNLPLNIDYTGKVVVITGAGGLICSAMARAFAQSGAKVAALDLNEEAVKAYQSVRYIMFHYWKNSEAKPFALTALTQLVSRADVPEGFMLRQEKEAKQFLLIEYDPSAMSDIGAYDILKAQRRGSNRYLPFVCKV